MGYHTKDSLNKHLTSNSKIKLKHIKNLVKIALKTSQGIRHFSEFYE